MHHVLPIIKILGGFAKLESVAAGFQMGLALLEPNDADGSFSKR
jgi:hypothetical protein